MIKVFTAGLPISAKDILSEAMNEAFGGSVDIVELTKENIRSRVRLSNRASDVCLVILDGVSSDLCKDIENGLYMSDRYHCYSSDKELALFLNSKYGLSIEVEDDVDIPVEVEDTEDSSDESKISELESYYAEKLAIKESTIANLECRIRELTEFYGSVDDEVCSLSSSEVEELKSQNANLTDENISLKNEILDLKSSMDGVSEEISSKETRIAELEGIKSSLEKRITSLSKNYDECVSELNKLKVAYSKQSGVIRDKESKIIELEKSSKECEALKYTVAENKKVIEDYKNSLVDKDAEIGNLKVDLQSKERENSRYLRELESLRGLGDVNSKLQSANATIDSLKNEIHTLSYDNDELKKSSKEKDRVISQLTDSNDESTKSIDSMSSELDELRERVKVDDENISQLNRDKLNLQSELDALKKSTESDSTVDALLADIKKLEEKNNFLSSNVFTKIGMLSMPNSSVGVRVLEGRGRLSNIRFVFSGSTDSRRGTYKCLLNEMRRMVNTRYLLVDLVSETSVDYVFEITKTVSGIEWFRRGGAVQNYISDTCIGNTKVLSAGLGYINDVYFLTVDWSKRLKELDDSGYKVVVFCGDLSNIVGRVLYESFSGFGDTEVYVSGSTVGSRAMITNMRGIANINRSKVKYFDFNPASSRFYEAVDRVCECEILSRRRK